MRGHLLRALLLVGGLIAASATPARSLNDGIDTDIGGHWHFTLAGPGGAAFLRFEIPLAGRFHGFGFGHSAQAKTTFAVTGTDALTFESSRNIVGTMQLFDVVKSGGEWVAGTTQIGTFSITRGVLSPDKDRLRLQGTIQFGAAPARPVRMGGVRAVYPDVTREGGSFDADVAGTGVMSHKYSVFCRSDDEQEYPNDENPSTKRFPIYTLDCSGPMRVDRTEQAGVRIDGLVIADPLGRVCGTVTPDARLGATGEVSHGAFTVSRLTPDRPGLGFRMDTDTKRRVRVLVPELKPLVE